MEDWLFQPVGKSTLPGKRPAGPTGSRDIPAGRKKSSFSVLGSLQTLRGAWLKQRQPIICALAEHLSIAGFVPLSPDKSHCWDGSFLSAPKPFTQVSRQKAPYQRFKTVPPDLSKPVIATLLARFLFANIKKSGWGWRGELQRRKTSHQSGLL